MSQLYEKFDYWINTDFREMNTQLEHTYENEGVLDQVQDLANHTKQELLSQGLSYVTPLLEEGNTDEGFDPAFKLLGNVGFFLAAIQRHQINIKNTQILRPIHSLAMHIGASIGMVPRFSTSHLTTHNTAFNGVYTSFTHLEDEKTFITHNTHGIAAYQSAARSLYDILALGISHPVTPFHLNNARTALEQVCKYNKILFSTLDTHQFFYHVRPYYKPYMVGFNEYRGANAGDFAGINVIDLLLGLCQANDASYSQLLVDKFLFMRPEEQSLLRDCMRQESLMSRFLTIAESETKSSWFQDNLKLFLDVCTAHGETARLHHDFLVNKFIEKPSKNIEQADREKITASGPPLEVLLASLEKLKDLRMAAPRTDIKSRYNDIEQLRSKIMER